MAEQPDEVPVTVYVVVVTGDADTLLPFTEFNPMDGDHVYVLPPFAVKETELPAQTGAGDEGLITITGTGFTVIITLAVPLHPDEVPVTV